MPSPSNTRNKASKSKALSRRATVVPGQYLGYALQATRMLDHLIEAKAGETVSLEVLGDTDVVGADGNVLVEEAKSRTTKNNPIGDRSLDFWKTFRNWIDAVQDGRLDPERTRFRLYVAIPFQPGIIIEQFNRATTIDDASIALNAARDLLFEKTQGGRKSSTAVPAKLRSHLDAVFNADPNHVATIIKHFELEIGSGRSIEAIKARLDSIMVPPEIVDKVFAYAAGWLKAQIDELLEQNQPASVTHEAFRKEMTAVIRQLDCIIYLASVAQEPPQDRVEEHLKLRTYVRQIALVDLDQDEQVRAVTDFIKAETDRVDWAEQGRVIESSFDEFERELTHTWRTRKRTCDIAHKGRSENELGQLLYSDCAAHVAKLSGIEVPEHFCRGSFHKLSDRQIIGWHPNYKALLNDKDTASVASISLDSTQQDNQRKRLAGRQAELFDDANTK